MSSCPKSSKITLRRDGESGPPCLLSNFNWNAAGGVKPKNKTKQKNKQTKKKKTKKGKC